MFSTLWSFSWNLTYLLLSRVSLSSDINSATHGLLVTKWLPDREKVGCSSWHCRLLMMLWLVNQKKWKRSPLYFLCHFPAISISFEYLCLISGLSLISFLIQFIVRHGSGEPETSYFCCNISRLLGPSVDTVFSLLFAEFYLYLICCWAKGLFILQVHMQPKVLQKETTIRIIL